MQYINEMMETTTNAISDQNEIQSVNVKNPKFKNVRIARIPNAKKDIVDSKNDSGDELTILQETLSIERSHIYDEFRDQAQAVWEGTREYLARRGAGILDRCNFGEFMNFCEDVMNIRPDFQENEKEKTLTALKHQRADLKWSDEFEAADPSY